MTLPSSVTRIVYQDIDEFALALRGTVGCFVRTARSVSHWWIEGIELAAASMQLLQTGGPFTFAGKGQPGTLSFHAPLSGATTLRVNGQVLDADSLVVLREERPFIWTGSDACQWVTVAVPSSHSLAASVLASETPNAAVRRRTSKTLLEEMKQLIDGASSREVAAAGNDQWYEFAEKQIASLVEQALKQSVPAGAVQRSGRPQLSRSRVIASALSCMNANEGQPIFIEDLCRATRVSERALRNIFHEYFGVGPMRLLKARQLHEIRAALLKTQPPLETVTEVASRYGVFDLSLLARNYKTLFGESPSQTLHRARTEPSEGVLMAWLKHASRIFMDADWAGK